MNNMEKSVSSEFFELQFDLSDIIDTDKSKIVPNGEKVILDPVRIEFPFKESSGVTRELGSILAYFKQADEPVLDAWMGLMRQCKKTGCLRKYYPNGDVELWQLQNCCPECITVSGGINKIELCYDNAIPLSTPKISRESERMNKIKITCTKEQKDHIICICPSRFYGLSYYHDNKNCGHIPCRKCSEQAFDWEIIDNKEEESDNNICTKVVGVKNENIN